MGIFGWLGESFNPGTVGSVDIYRPEKLKRRSRGEVILRFILAAALVIVVCAFIFPRKGFTSDQTLVFAIAGIIYLVVSYFVRPRPDYSNVGLLGGLLDNPFRITDDFNRFLVYLMIALLPGQFIVESYLNFGILLANANK